MCTLLNATQTAAALALRAKRPTVIPGTNVILRDSERSAWYAEVSAMLDKFELNARQTFEFCNLAGVPN